MTARFLRHGFGGVFIVLIAITGFRPSMASSDDLAVSPELPSLCEVGIPLAESERKDLLSRLRASKTGAEVIRAFEAQYGSLSKLYIQWDSVSYSQIARPVTTARAERAPAAQSVAQKEKSGRLGEAVCVHLAHKLPDIEHLADLVHELTHATRLELSVLRGDVEKVDEFVHARLAASGGEADAFSVECTVKREILGRWDALCAPYVDGEAVSVKRVIEDFYAGKLSASLTGEPYPVMLGRQFLAIRKKRASREKRDSVTYSALENKSGIQ